MTFDSTAGELRRAGHFVPRDVPDHCRVRKTSRIAQDGVTLLVHLEVWADGYVSAVTVEGLEVGQA